VSRAKTASGVHLISNNAHIFQTIKQKRIKTVSNKYQTTPKNHEKTRPNPKSNGKNKPHQ